MPPRHWFCATSIGRRWAPQGLLLSRGWAPSHVWPSLRPPPGAQVEWREVAVGDFIKVTANFQTNKFTLEHHGPDLSSGSWYKLIDWTYTGFSSGTWRFVQNPMHSEADYTEHRYEVIQPANCVPPGKAFDEKVCIECKSSENGVVKQVAHFDNFRVQRYNYAEFNPTPSLYPC